MSSLTSPRRSRVQPLGMALAACCVWALWASAPLRAQTVLQFKYTPAPRAQVAIWIESAKGQFLSTVALTESVGFRGIGNRPGASDMNSGYRWPYGRREGVLPIWAHRRASAPGARLFPRVIFQARVEGHASRSTSDQSPDAYYCLQFDAAKSGKDQLDAISCATPFSSDKGRYLAATDAGAQYGEPYEPSPGTGIRAPLPRESYYPPRMDVARCAAAGSCFDSEDVAHFAEDARAVMPEIDAVTIATPPGDTQQRVLFTVPSDWPAGTYSAFIEVNLEGDYNAAWSATAHPTPTTPQDDWDVYSLTYGYAYRGQPSLVWKLEFTLGGSGEVRAATSLPIGRSSWDYWSEHYGAIETITFDAGAPSAISTTAAHSGVQRLAANATGDRFEVVSMRGSPTGPTQPPTAGSRGVAGAAGSATDGSAGRAGALGIAGTGGMEAGAPAAGSASQEPAEPTEPPIGPVEDLSLERDPNPLRAHTWVRLRMRAVRSEVPLHAYEVRVATEPIRDELTFIRNGRQAKNATDAREGATLLSLPTDVPAGQWIESAIGDLAAETHYYIGVRATDEWNRHGPLSVVEYTTPVRRFTTVTPCFIASVAYGSPLASEVSVLRRVRDRYLLPNGLGRVWVRAYYRVGEDAAAWIAQRPRLRGVLQTLLAPVVAVARALE